MGRYPRRTALHLGSTVLVTALAGCSADSSDPDAGTDSYGITARNTREDGPHEVEVVAQPIGGDPVFERTVKLAPGESSSWDEVLTAPGQTQVKANVVDEERHFGDRFKLASNYVTVGGESAPEVTDVVVELYAEDANGQLDEPVTGVRVRVGNGTGQG
jgi:hypothetical protein